MKKNMSKVARIWKCKHMCHIYLLMNTQNKFRWQYSEVNIIPNIGDVMDCKFHSMKQMVGVDMPNLQELSPLEILVLNHE